LAAVSLWCLLLQSRFCDLLRADGNPPRPALQLLPVKGKAMTEPAKLPSQFITKPEVHLEDLKSGESGWVTFTEMAIDSEHRAYINAKAKVVQKGVNRIQVTRTDAGFEVFIPDPTLDWKPGGYHRVAHQIFARYVPVVKFTSEQS
jgi:hypothetical protein